MPVVLLLIAAALGGGWYYEKKKNSLPPPGTPNTNVKPPPGSTVTPVTMPMLQAWTNFTKDPHLPTMTFPTTTPVQSVADFQQAYNVMNPPGGPIVINGLVDDVFIKAFNATAALENLGQASIVNGQFIYTPGTAG